jgi:enterochelin esterase-like enzyme
MHKRQASQPQILTAPFCWFLLGLIAFLLAACSPGTTPIPTATHTVTLTPTAITPQPSATGAIATPTPTATSISPSFTPTEDCLQFGGTLESLSLPCDLLKEDLNIKIYLPPCYASQTDQTYPVIYLLHGLSYTNQQWVRLGVVEHMDTLIKEGKIAPAIVVLPQEELAPPPQIIPYSEVLIQHLVPWVDENFRTIPGKDFRALGGLSRGAAWAVRIGFENPDLFSKIGAHSLPLFKVDGVKVPQWLQETTRETLPEFFIDIGQGDPERQTAQTFADQLDAFGVPHEWYLLTGFHTEEYWSEHIDLYLAWYTRDW